MSFYETAASFPAQPRAGGELSSSPARRPTGHGGWNMEVEA